MLSRREIIIAKLNSRTVITDLGYLIDGVPSPCFIWQGAHSGSGKGGGYGRMSLDGHTVAVHLVSFTHFYGYIPGSKQVDHLCKNRLCWNPAHLDLVTHIQNQKRKTAILVVPIVPRIY